MADMMELAEVRARYIADVADRMARRMGGRFVIDPARWDAFVQAHATRTTPESNNG